MPVRILKNKSQSSLALGALISFERMIGVTLPGDHRNFLLEYNGGQPEPAFFWLEKETDGSDVYRFYGLYDEPRPDSLKTFSREGRRGFPETMLPIADDGVGNFLCLGISQENFGEIFFLDHDEYPYPETDSMVGVTKLANSFTEFLESLTDAPE